MSQITDERWRMFLRDALPYRTLPVQISPADERRLIRNIEAFNADMPSDPMNPQHDEDLAIALMGCAMRGLDDGDDDAGVWSDLDGRDYSLPRPNRSPWHKRAKYAARAAITTWRAT